MVADKRKHIYNKNSFLTLFLMTSALTKITNCDKLSFLYWTI